MLPQLELLLLVAQSQLGQFGVVGVSKKFAVKPALLGGLCLLGALLLAWISPPEGAKGLSGMVEREGMTEMGKTKARDRGDEVIREVRSVAEEYLMKAKRGMTNDEVRWLVEDFVVLGLDLEYPEDKTAEGYLSLRKAREDWYLGALVSGLRLTKEQEREARERMGVLREKDYAVFVEYLDGLKSFEHEGKEMKVFDGGKGRRLMDADIWMNNEGYRPWELCELEEEQLSMTWGAPKLQTRDTPGKRDGGSVEWLWKEPGKDGERAESTIQDPFDPRHVSHLKEIGGVFPLSEIQYRRLSDPLRDGGETPMLRKVMFLNKEQLKIYMLLLPILASELSNNLEKAHE